jgi:V/A-type H+-transporting ATPase subunit E
MALIPQGVSPKQVTELLAKGVLERVKENNIVLGNFSGGVQVKLSEKNMTVDISEEALKEVVARYVRKDFRKLIFGI